MLGSSRAKGSSVRFTNYTVLACSALLMLGCAHVPLDSGPPSYRLQLRFSEDTVQTYRFVHHRDVEIQWEPDKGEEASKNSTHRMTETLDMVMAYRPLQAAGQYTELEVTCQSVSVKRTQLTGGTRALKDAVEHLQGRAFTISVDPQGRLTDTQVLDTLLKDLGKRAFRNDAKMGRIKNPEMISDVVATQWFLWHALASMDPNGVTPGQSWQSQLSLPTPMVMRKARDVTYTLAQVTDTDQGHVAEIHSDFSLSQNKAPSTWPIPYAGSFRASGPFGFLRGYRNLKLEGTGQERFNLDQGRSLGYDHQYRLEMDASMPLFGAMGGTSPKIVIQQTLKMETVDSFRGQKSGGRGQ